MHEHHSPDVSGEYLTGIVVVLVLAAVGAYLAAVWRLRARGDHWSWWPAAAALSCGVLLIVAALAPLPGEPFATHMVVGMVAPLALVLARPITLALRALGKPARARLLGIVRSRVVAVLMFPPVAAVLDIGGLWLLYRTGMFAAVHDRMGLHAVVFVHVFASGVLFSAAVTQLEPVRHRYSLLLRAATLVAAAAGHAIWPRPCMPPDRREHRSLSAMCSSAPRSCITAVTLSNSRSPRSWPASGTSRPGALNAMYYGDNNNGSR
ncbi:cytochrome c oxidase assembly protein [Nocardia asteroides]|uniref:Cytochrome c oxidase assembly protein n=1 Tax=Nocardia asteroides NBRC 15531 TaxID=1110697 RepID=U5E3R4_NOCAS|nr:cytochrome c oxidase assembly protein [Nocardia asteroides]UGT50814.1 cytochrome c oxidase assembly protein [Nocardia asteroides]GAD82987.1 hypothetical protein NCAST_16_00020 [Nocardia asteroides NBRC 15531]